MAREGAREGRVRARRRVGARVVAAVRVVPPLPGPRRRAARVGQALAHERHRPPDAPQRREVLPGEGPEVPACCQREAVQQAREQALAVGREEVRRAPGRPAAGEPGVAVPVASVVGRGPAGPGARRVEVPPGGVAVHAHDAVPQVLDVVELPRGRLGVAARRNVHARHVDAHARLVVRVRGVLLRARLAVPPHGDAVDGLREVADVVGPLCVLFHRAARERLIAAVLARPALLDSRARGRGAWTCHLGNGWLSYDWTERRHSGGGAWGAQGPRVPSAVRLDWTQTLQDTFGLPTNSVMFNTSEN